MQNCYACDVGDFGKYGLLKYLCISGEVNEKSELNLGVVWYLVPDENQNNDGKHTDYLKSNSENEKFRKCDPKLYDELAEIFHKERNISQISGKNILPPSTSFYDKPLTFAEIPSNGPKARDMRLKKRKEWAQEAFKKTEMCNVIFFDPDNGLEIKSIKSHNKSGPKYAFFDELSPYLQRNQSLVIYQHIGRNVPAEKQIDDRFKELRKHLNSSSSAFALHYHRGTSRVFFIVPAKNHKIILLKRANLFVEGPWKNHFTLITQ